MVEKNSALAFQEVDFKHFWKRQVKYFFSTRRLPFARSEVSIQELGEQSW